jgi:hypothetical protein
MKEHLPMIGIARGGILRDSLIPRAKTGKEHNT